MLKYIVFLSLVVTNIAFSKDWKEEVVVVMNVDQTKTKLSVNMGMTQYNLKRIDKGLFDRTRNEQNKTKFERNYFYINNGKVTRLKNGKVIKGWCVNKPKAGEKLEDAVKELKYDKIEKSVVKFDGACNDLLQWDIERNLKDPGFIIATSGEKLKVKYIKTNKTTGTSRCKMNQNVFGINIQDCKELQNWEFELFRELDAELYLLKTIEKNKVWKSVTEIIMLGWGQSQRIGFPTMGSRFFYLQEKLKEREIKNARLEYHIDIDSTEYVMLSLSGKLSLDYGMLKQGKEYFNKYYHLEYHPKYKRKKRRNDPISMQEDHVVNLVMHKTVGRVSDVFVLHSQKRKIHLTQFFHSVIHAKTALIQRFGK